ncbi:MAG: SDR family oxidoreductase [Rhodospirillaceae bacterium]|mgnify:FL=1|jgi:NAD(P)-dependent dehydrogenase (short-subunit alcohol dehydrogenase family)|nr:SDR family oxidoreductase [Rhodospirillaceae bacterium]MBT4044376.1 SDR family oxidoreductase [Rhodospirillaceae bacterium]MBT4686486.1 SDR family oxidoreductase [Rhodospirillaceae bacterium]MBT5083831.1 SDR family oxidoreductase [Rhodospirillaceae bacterium]MBT5526268.1 SDR family oxidoreductase [Rhodospirillaceae bacterium]
MDISGKKAVVFGGTSGIGLAAAKQLAAQGAEVIAISRNPDKAGDMPDGITLRQCDVRDREALSVLFADCAPFDILVSAATGGDRAVGPFMKMDMDGFQGSFDKLWGYANVVRFGTQYLAESGAIVLVSGTPARRAKPGQIAIGSVGGAVEAFVRTVASEIAPRRINVVSPGTINTPMVALTGAEREAFYDKATAQHPIPRAGTAEECAHAILFLIQNDFTTGTTVDVDGGWLLA